MRNVKFKTQYNSEPFSGEVIGPEYCIDPTGYIPPKRQIENMLYAGLILDSSRKEDYDFNGDEKLEYRKEFDVRRPDFDRVDATAIVSELYSSGKASADSGSDDGKSSESSVSDSGSGDSGTTE